MSIELPETKIVLGSGRRGRMRPMVQRIVLDTGEIVTVQGNLKTKPVVGDGDERPPSNEDQPPGQVASISLKDVVDLAISVYDKIVGGDDDGGGGGGSTSDDTVTVTVSGAGGRRLTVTIN
ncbi:hypothetical protein E8P82_11625 [Arthrobacter echini]|uniref:Uncharacterized protein n=1 Tax=Arthrobacter echini TaxID=1529066 RepID=A0A4S5E2K4_9MICC|nr:hypothetical protein [Arthrobacter echini]THJ65616.1 hypothetical protein E8P82_11625 [Arthrobacter echini]